MPITSTPYTAVYGPLSVAGATCQLWLDGVDPLGNGSVPANGSTLTSLVDKSIAKRNFIVGSGTTTYTANTIKLNNSYMYVTSAIDLTSLTYFIIAKTNSLVDNTTVFIGRPNTTPDYGSTDGFGFYMDSASLTDVRFYGSYLGSPPPNPIVVTTSIPNIYTSQSSGTTVSTWINGISKTGNTLTSTRTNTAKGFAIGASWDGSAYGNIVSNASIYEIIVYNVALTTPQQQAIEGYLAQKWGLTSQLPPGHPGLTQTFYNSKVYLSRVPLSPQPIYQNFNPKQLTGCQLWLDGADPAGTGTPPANGSTVSTWIDKSGNGRNASANTIGGTFNRNALNGNGGINFDTLNTKYYRTPSFVASSTNTPTIFFVCQQTVYNFSQNTTLLLAEINYLQFILYTRTAGNTNINLNLDMYNTDISPVFPTGIPISSPAIVSVVGTGAPSYTATMYGNGTFNLTFTGTATNPMSTSSPYIIGQFIGNAYEVIFYNTALADTQRQQVEGYLAWKWGLQNSLVNHPYKNVPPGLPWQASLTSGLTRLPPIVATGGTITFSGAFKIHTFTTVGTTNFVVSQVLPSGFSLEVLVVGGGGGGGGDVGGGGGAGGYQLLTNYLVSQGSYPITIGIGGTGVTSGTGSSGGSSSFANITATGGSGGTSYNDSTQNGGAAGTGGFSGGTGYPGGGNGGGGGGGGLGGAGVNGALNTGGTGGIGITYNRGTTWLLGGGGGGAANTLGTASYGGGNGGNRSGTSAVNGTPNTGGGGGGGSYNSGVVGANGGSGIVIISYLFS